MERSPFLVGGLSWVFGEDPPPVCPACGFSWDIPFEEALASIGGSPARIADVLEERDGMVEMTDGSWNATAYVWHLADLARSWSERWVQIATDPGSLLVGFDPDELADARGYRRLPTTPALWAVRRAVDDLVDATGALSPEATFEHGDWGTGTMADGIRWLAHEFHHHERDISARAG